MGRLEKDLAKEIRRTRINTAIIHTIVAAGTIATALVAPNVLGAMGKLGLMNPHQKRQSIKKSFSKLIDRGYITLEDGRARLTKKGEKFAALLGEGRLAPQKPRRWDGKWRVLIFDIPERRRGVRERIRNTLIGLGFRKLQDSVWAYPYDCEDLITLLKVDLRVGRDVLYLIVDRLEFDAPLRAHFGLEP